MGFSLLVIGSNTIHAEELVIAGNGSDSSNEVVVSSSSQNTIIQTNEAEIQNNIEQSAETGGNSISTTTGGGSTTQTGNTQMNTAVQNTANTSVATPGCCPAPPGNSTTISGNGTNSENEITTASNTQTHVTSNQNAAIKNTIKGKAETGGNVAYGNSGGVTIKTGEIRSNVSVVNDPINISFIQISDSVIPLSAAIFKNGNLSKNTIIAVTDSNRTIEQSNNVSIDNVISLDFLTGGNKVKDVGGVVKIITGDIFSNVSLKNNANINLALVKCVKAEELSVSPTPHVPSPTVTGAPGKSVGGNGGAAPTGQLLPEAASTERVTSAPSVYGLSKTSSDNIMSGLLIGAVLIAFGAFLFFRGIGSTTK
jgi:hypothetical protein